MSIPVTPPEAPGAVRYIPRDKFSFNALDIQPEGSEFTLLLHKSPNFLNMLERRMLEHINQAGGDISVPVEIKGQTTVLALSDCRPNETKEATTFYISGISALDALNALKNLPGFMQYLDFMEMTKVITGKYANGYGYLPMKESDHFMRHYANFSLAEGPVESIHCKKMGIGKYDTDFHLRTGPGSKPKVLAALRMAGIGQTSIPGDKQGECVIALRGIEKPLEALLVADPKEPGKPWITEREYTDLCINILGKDPVWMAAHPYHLPGQRIKNTGPTQMGLFPS